MKKSILIGFEYAPPISRLPGIVWDLKQMYKRQRRMKPDRTLVVTDIAGLSFRKAEVYKFGGLEDMMQRLAAFAEGADQLLLYYTGHARDGYFVLPDGGGLPMESISNLLSQTVVPNGQIICLLDCCNSTGFGLPYRMIRDGTFDFRPAMSFFSQQIVCVSSSLETERSACTRSGSIFTRALSKLLKRRVSVLTEIYRGCMKSVGTHEQTVSIGSSHPNLRTLWPWLYGQQTIMDQFRCLLFNS